MKQARVPLPNLPNVVPRGLHRGQEWLCLLETSKKQDSNSPIGIQSGQFPFCFWLISGKNSCSCPLCYFWRPPVCVVSWSFPPCASFRTRVYLSRLKPPCSKSLWHGVPCYRCNSCNDAIYLPNAPSLAKGERSFFMM